MNWESGGVIQSQTSNATFKFAFKSKLKFNDKEIEFI